MIKFDVTNPAVKVKDAPQNVLYLGEKNTLHFLFSVSANAVQFNPGDTILVQAKSGLLSAPDNVQLHSNTDWDFAYKNSSGNDVFVLTAQKQVNINPLSACEMELSGFQAANLSTNFVFSTRYVIGGRPQSGVNEPIIILNAPENLQDLRTEITFTNFINDNQPGGQAQLPENILYVSLPDLNPPIANSLHLNLAYGGQEPLISAWGDKTPQITLFFSYGLDSNDLTDDIQSNDPNPPKAYNAFTSAWNIGARLSGPAAPFWNLQPPQQNTGAPYPAWIITPQADNKNLFSKDMPVFDIYFDGVVSCLPQGVAIMYVQWNNIPGYFDSAKAVAVNKQAPASPQVLAFECANAQQQTPEALQLSWTLFAANRLLLTWDNGLQSKQWSLPNPVAKPQLTYCGQDSSIVPDQPDTTLEYQPQNSANALGASASVDIFVSDFPAPRLTAFKGVYQKNSDNSWSILFSWQAKNLGGRFVFTLNGVRLGPPELEGKPFTGTAYPFSYVHLVTEPVVATNFILEATDLTNDKTGRVAFAPDFPDEITPRILSFTAKVFRDENGVNGVQFDAAVQQVTDQSSFTVSSDAGIVQQPSPSSNGKISFFIPITDNNPAQPTYTLVATNPSLKSASQTTQLINSNNV
jgi:hypothetical protein